MKSLHLVDQQPALTAVTAPSPLVPRPVEAPDANLRTDDVRHTANRLTSRLGNSKDADVINLSLSGFAVETDKYLLIGQSYPVRLFGTTKLSLTAEAVWCRMVGTTRNQRDEIEPVYRAGFKFVDLTKDGRWQLRKLIRQSRPETACGIADPTDAEPS